MIARLRAKTPAIIAKLKYLRVLIAAVVVSALAIGLWQWHSAKKEEALARRQAWVEYLQGPLSDLLYGSSRMRPLLAVKKLNKLQAAEAKDAIDHLRRSGSRSQFFASAYQFDPLLKSLADAKVWHEEINTLFEPWKYLAGKPLAKEALVVEGDMRLRLWTVLAGIREKFLAEKLLNKDEVLEMNALLYSLKEGAEVDTRGPGKL